MVNDCMMANGCLSNGEKEKGFDPGFKLFGKTIPMCGYPSPNNGIEVEEKKPAVAGESESKQEEEPIVVESSSSPEFNKDKEGSLESEEEEEERSSSEVENRKDGDDDNSNSEGKNGGEKPVLKKPDKLLPCPRCESMDTKFCYYNNYNVNQPRHFCKNCQRYWTAGGTLRNVPVGAGRRKNKHSASAASAVASHYRQIRSASETAAVAALGVRTDDPEGVMIPCALPAPCVRPFKLGGSRIQVLPLDILDSGSAVAAAASTGGSASTVLNFGPDGRSNKIPGDGEQQQMDWQRQQQHSKDEISCGSSVTGDRDTAGHMNPPSHPHADALKWTNGAMAGAAGAPFFAGPWSYAWNFAAAPAPWAAPMSWPVVSRSQFGGWAPAPWIAAPWAAAATTTYNSAEPAPTSDCGSPTLGKRAQCEPEGKTPNGSLWVPKTLRIDDPGEAAKSSIWTTLGVGNKPESTISGGGMFKAFQPKSDSSSKNSPLKPEPASQALCANPAAFSRSISFQESN